MYLAEMVARRAKYINLTNEKEIKRERKRQQ